MTTYAMAAWRWSMPTMRSRRTSPRVPVRTHVVPYKLAQANEALEDLRHGRLQGAAVLMC